MDPNDYWHLKYHSKIITFKKRLFIDVLQRDNISNKYFVEVSNVHGLITPFYKRDVRIRDVFSSVIKIRRSCFPFFSV